MVAWKGERQNPIATGTREGMSFFIVMISINREQEAFLCKISFPLWKQGIALCQGGQLRSSMYVMVPMGASY